VTGSDPLVQQHLRRLPSSLNTSSHSLNTGLRDFPPRRRRGPPSSAVSELFILPPSDIAPPHDPPSPYWIPLWGSSGLISPSSILVRIIRASREKMSSTLSPERAETSTDTGMPCLDAHCDASSSETSLPSAVTVAVFCEPSPNPLELTELREVPGRGVLKLSTLDGITVGASLSGG
jgi:hypothetical protein